MCQLGTLIIFSILQVFLDYSWSGKVKNQSFEQCDNIEFLILIKWIETENWFLIFQKTGFYFMNKSG